MARAKQSDEEKILDYFNDAPVQAAGTLFNVVKGIMKRRGVGEAAKKGQGQASVRPAKSKGAPPMANTAAAAGTGE